ncbi:MAG: DoxX family protein [Candidatus Omnitrophica bacterium]|nr:DoxX family protein [Candidatus Omnitrophota bacterium]MBU4478073.1 DoxX family protein [Candidatus Omnitrophota bacterium]MCG2704355.1 DoxX family protein [Candidatus Omnitrophota bacterium]
MAKKNAQKYYGDIGLLILRLGLGAMFIFHGWPKISGGAQLWPGFGEAVSFCGINFGFMFWGFMAACAEFFGGIFIALGIAFRLFCFLLAITMIVASFMHLGKGEGLAAAAHAIEMGIVFISLFFIGPGNFHAGNLVQMLGKKKRNK